MNWKLPKSNLFWVPFPFDPEQNLSALTEWKSDPKSTCHTVEITDSETRQNHRAEILDYLGAYPIRELPDHLARQCADSKNMTGELLTSMLYHRHPAFKGIEKVIFYQLSKQL